MFLANPRVRAGLRTLITAGLLVYGLWLISHSGATTFDRILGAFITLCEVVAIVAGILAKRAERDSTL